MITSGEKKLSSNNNINSKPYTNMTPEIKNKSVLKGGEWL